jgi:hypothetical protein
MSAEARVAELEKFIGAVFDAIGETRRALTRAADALTLTAAGAEVVYPEELRALASELAGEEGGLSVLTEFAIWHLEGRTVGEDDGTYPCPPDCAVCGEDVAAVGGGGRAEDS